MQTATLEHVQQLANQLIWPEQLKLLKHVVEHLNQEVAVDFQNGRNEEQARRARQQLADQLLAEVEDVEDDSVGRFDAAETIQQMREERTAQLCRNDA